MGIKNFKVVNFGDCLGRSHQNFRINFAFDETNIQSNLNLFVFLLYLLFDDGIHRLTAQLLNDDTERPLSFVM